MREFLIRTDVSLDEISSVTYDETASEVVLRTGHGEFRYKMEESIETYVIGYETPRFVNHIAK
jgi:hypothetical protein